MKIIFFIFFTLLVNHNSVAQSETDPHWPCIQVLVPEISAASIWDGPSTAELQNDDRFKRASTEILTGVVENLEPLTEQQLDSYLSTVGDDQPNNALTYLFKTFLDRFNQKRKNQIDTIKRYTQSQIKSAKSIETLLDKKAELEKNQAGSNELVELETNLHWQKRMFKEREQSFRYLCELPQEIAQQAGETARMISARLEY